MSIVTETEARKLHHCPACGAKKLADNDMPHVSGWLVCWECFKGEGGFKYSGLDFADWLAQVREDYLQELLAN